MCFYTYSEVVCDPFIPRSEDTDSVADVRVTSFLISSEDWQSGSSDCMLTGLNDLDNVGPAQPVNAGYCPSSGNGGGGNESNPGNSVASTSRAARFMAFLSVASGAEMSKSGNSGGGTLASSSDALTVAAISGSGTDSEIKTMQQRTRFKSLI